MYTYSVIKHFYIRRKDETRIWTWGWQSLKHLFIYLFIFYENKN